MSEREYHSVNWEVMREAWEKNEIRLGADVQLSLLPLTDPETTDTLKERLSLDSEGGYENPR